MFRTQHVGYSQYLRPFVASLISSDNQRTAAVASKRRSGSFPCDVEQCAAFERTPPLTPSPPHHDNFLRNPPTPTETIEKDITRTCRQARTHPTAVHVCSTANQSYPRPTKPLRPGEQTDLQFADRECIPVEEVPEVLDSLSSTLIFNSANKEERLALASRLRHWVVADGTYLIREGDGDRNRSAIFMIGERVGSSQAFGVDY